MGVKKTVLRWLVPSHWVEWLNGKKRALGIIALVLWFLMFGLAVVCSTPECLAIISYAGQVQEFLLSVNVNLDETLLSAGAGLTVVGFIDWILNHLPSEKLVQLLESFKL